MLKKDWKKQIAGLTRKMEQNQLYVKLKPYLDQFVQWRAPNSNQLVGLDIGPSSVKLLKINKINSDKYQVEYFALSDLPEGAISKDEIKDFSAVGAVIKEMFRQSGINSKQVALVIPRSLAIIKHITIDARLNAEEIESRAWIEAQRHFPELIGDIYLDFAVMGPSQQNPGQLEMDLVASRKEHIKPYLEIARQSGVTAKVLDVDCYALERALEHLIQPEKEKVVAMLNLNINISTLIVVQNRRLVYSHDQIFDGKRLMSQIDKFKANNGLQNITNEEVILANETYDNLLKDVLIAHLRHTIHFFYSSRPNIAIEEFVISGDCSRIVGLARFIEKEIGVKTMIADPLNRMIFAPGVNEEEFKAKAPALMLCCGLAMSDLPV